MSYKLEALSLIYARDTNWGEFSVSFFNAFLWVPRIYKRALLNCCWTRLISSLNTLLLKKKIMGKKIVFLCRAYIKTSHTAKTVWTWHICGPNDTKLHMTAHEHEHILPAFIHSDAADSVLFWTKFDHMTGLGVRKSLQTISERK